METRIAELREAQGMKRTELAARAGVGYGQLTKWENGTNEISLDGASKVARALGVKVSDLIMDAPKRDERFDEIARAYRSMSEDGKNRLLSMARWILQEDSGGKAEVGVKERTA